MEVKEVSKLFLTNFKESARFYNFLKQAKEEYSEKTKDMDKSDLTNYPDLFICEQLETSVGIVEKTFAILEEKLGEERTEHLKNMFINGVSEIDTADRIDMPIRTFRRKRALWLGYAEEIVKGEMLLKKGVHYGDYSDMPAPTYDFPKIPDDSKDVDKQWKAEFKNGCKQVDLNLKNISMCNATIDLTRHNMAGVHSRFPHDEPRVSGSSDRNVKYLRAIEKIDRYTKHREEYQNKVDWIFTYMRRNPNPLARTVAPLMYIRRYRTDDVVEPVSMTLKVFRLAMDKALTYPGKKDLK